MTSVEPAIRPIEDPDVDAVIDLWNACGLVVPSNDPARDLAFARSKDNCVVQVADAEGQIAASAMAGHDGHRGQLYYVAVVPRRQRSGLGRQIVRAAEAWLKGQGIWKVNLVICASNVVVRGFYERIGYQHEDRVNMARHLDEE